MSLATTMTIFGLIAGVTSMQRAVAMGQKDAGLAFSIVPWSGILFFAVVFAIGIAMVRRPEVHKRLMLLAGISILDAAVARWFLTFLAPPGPPGPPPVAVTIPPAFVAYLLLVVAIVNDWRTRGRPHKVYVIGGLALVAVKLLNLPISQTHAWHAFAGAILTLSQGRSSVGRRLARPGRERQLFTVIPPSTMSSMPVMYFNSSDARNSAALATSHASPMCPIGTWASRARHIASTSPAE